MLKNKKLETRNQKLETSNLNQETRNQKLETRRSAQREVFRAKRRPFLLAVRLYTLRSNFTHMKDIARRQALPEPTAPYTPSGFTRPKGFTLYTCFSTLHGACPYTQLCCLTRAKTITHNEVALHSDQHTTST